MIRFAFSLAIVAAAGFAGWIVGSVYPAPASLVAQVNPRALEERAIAGLSFVDWSELQKRLSPEQAREITQGALAESAAAGEAIIVESVDAQTLAELAPEAVAPAAPVPIAATQVAGGPFEAELKLCPRMAVSNAPPAAADGKVTSYKPTIVVEGVTLASFPTRGACLSSGFGPRNGRAHRGVDFHAAEGGPILAAADGVILEKKYRDDYGNMLLIDHGNGVYTRYAHLASFARGLAAGAQVKAGQEIGLMGNTASYRVPIHLHYEVLVGNYDTPKQSFGLTPVNPLG